MSRLLHDMDVALDRMGSWDLYADIGHAFAEAIPETEAAIADAIKRKMWHEARRMAHSLKSNCSAMGAEELRDRVHILEKACADGNEANAVSLFAGLREDLRQLREELMAL